MAAVLDRADVDTDQIMPKQFLKRIERTGFGEFLFFDWAKDPDFELNRPEFAGREDPARRPELRLRLVARARTLGRSRTPGSRSSSAPSFGDIFRQNCIKIGLVPIVLPAAQVKRL